MVDRQQCYGAGFDFINNCKTLREFFDGCPNGCDLETGHDLPAYVVQKSAHNYQTCIVSADLLSCTGKNRATTRLCPCRPVPT